jgi:hypothetical protein
MKIKYILIIRRHKAGKRGAVSSRTGRGLKPKVKCSSTRRKIIFVNGWDVLALDVYFSLFGYDMIDQMQIHLIMGIRCMPAGHLVKRALNFLSIFYQSVYSIASRSGRKRRTLDETDPVEFGLF